MDIIRCSPAMVTFKKILSACKPDSVIRLGGPVIIYLVAALLPQSSCLPSGAVQKVRSDGPPFSATRNTGLHGISAHKVYPATALLLLPVSSYLTFSPLLRFAPERLFSVALSVQTAFRQFIPGR